MLFEKIQLEDDEHILIIVRKHWFVFLLRVLGVLTTALLPVIIVLVVAHVSTTSILLGETFSHFGNEISFLIALWLLINWTTLAFLWTDQYLDLWVVTNKRIISIDQKRLFFRTIGSFRLERLQDLNIEIPGFLATIFNYGNIEAQTASGSKNEFRVHGLPNPAELKSIILSASDALMRSRTAFTDDGV